MINLDRLQSEVNEWASRNFGTSRDPKDPVLGVAEETGELCHAILKMSQRIRGTKQEHEGEAIDAIGDIIIYLADTCNLYGWSLQSCLEATWAHVKKRDWTKDHPDA
jgi:NTP pyrophosphatase (non-canonical NTP hydrolase)